MKFSILNRGFLQWNWEYFKISFFLKLISSTQVEYNATFSRLDRPKLLIDHCCFLIVTGYFGIAMRVAQNFGEGWKRNNCLDKQFWQTVSSHKYLLILLPNALPSVLLQVNTDTVSITYIKLEWWHLLPGSPLW